MFFVLSVLQPWCSKNANAVKEKGKEFKMICSFFTQQNSSLDIDNDNLSTYIQTFIDKLNAWPARAIL
jgi:hypothetical protein